MLFDTFDVTAQGVISCILYFFRAHSGRLPNLRRAALEKFPLKRIKRVSDGRGFPLVGYLRGVIEL